MPYIPKKDRAKYQSLLNELAGLVPKEHQSRAGNINYIVSLLLSKVYGEEIRYADHNEIIGVLTCIKDEFYRRYTAPYEDKKILSKRIGAEQLPEVLDHILKVKENEEQQKGD